MLPSWTAQGLVCCPTVQIVCPGSNTCQKHTKPLRMLRICPTPMPAGEVRVLEGHPFIVEAAISLGGRDIKAGINVYRFANRIPLLFEVCAVVEKCAVAGWHRDKRWAVQICLRKKETHHTTAAIHFNPFFRH